MRTSVACAIAAMAAATLWAEPIRAEAKAVAGLTCSRPAPTWTAAAGFGLASLAAIRIGRRRRHLSA